MVAGVLVAGSAAIKLVGMGFCLGLGFYISRKTTERIDEWLVLADKEYMAQLANSITPG